MSRLPFVLVGCGRWGRRVLAAVAHHPDIDLRVVVEPDAAARRAARALVPQLQVVETLAQARRYQVRAGYVATPSARHHRDAAQLLAGGCDALVEKPLCAQAAQVRNLMQRARQSGQLIMVGHLLRFHPAYETLIERARGGAIGRLRSVHARRVSSSRSSEVLSRLAPHDFATLYALDGSQLLGCEARRRHHEVRVSLRLASGLRAQLTLSTCGPERQRLFRLVGEAGELQVDELDEVTPLRFLHEARSRAALPCLSDGRDPLRRQLDHFVQCVRSRRPPRTGLAEALWTVSAIEQTREAFRAAGIAAAV